MCSLHVYVWLRVKLKVKGTGFRSVLSWRLYHCTRQFLMCWLCVYMGLPVKLNSKSSGVQGVKSWNLDHRMREFVMLLATRLHVAMLQN